MSGFKPCDDCEDPDTCTARRECALTPERRRAAATYGVDGVRFIIDADSESFGGVQQ